MTNFSCVSIYNNKNYITILLPEYNMRFVLGFCAISPIRKHKQRLSRSLTFKIFNTFLVGINMFKVNKKNTGTSSKLKVNNKDIGTTSICYLCF